MRQRNAAQGFHHLGLALEHSLVVRSRFLVASERVQRMTQRARHRDFLRCTGEEALERFDGVAITVQAEVEDPGQLQRGWPVGQDLELLPRVRESQDEIAARVRARGLLMQGTDFLRRRDPGAQSLQRSASARGSSSAERKARRHARRRAFPVRPRVSRRVARAPRAGPGGRYRHFTGSRGILGGSGSSSCRQRSTATSRARCARRSANRRGAGSRVRLPSPKCATAGTAAW